jgi:hypothetical protein
MDSRRSMDPRGYGRTPRWTRTGCATLCGYTDGSPVEPDAADRIASTNGRSAACVSASNSSKGVVIHTEVSADARQRIDLWTG